MSSLSITHTHTHTPSLPIIEPELMDNSIEISVLDNADGAPQVEIKIKVSAG